MMCLKRSFPLVLLIAVSSLIAGGALGQSITTPVAPTEKEAEMAEELYVSIDVESDGPIPGPHSMLSFGAAAFRADKTPVGTFTANLETLPGATADPKTAEWWKTQPEAWAACRQDLQPPETAMKNFADWLEALPGKPVCVGYPVAFDFMFVAWYLHRFAGRNPFSHSALDIKTLAMAAMKTPYRRSTKGNMPKRWFDSAPHTHKALDDAIEQGLLFCNIWQEVLGGNVPGADGGAAGRDRLPRR